MALRPHIILHWQVSGNFSTHSTLSRILMSLLLLQIIFCYTVKQSPPYAITTKFYYSFSTFKTKFDGYFFPFGKLPVPVEAQQQSQRNVRKLMKLHRKLIIIINISNNAFPYMYYIFVKYEFIMETEF